ncbi:MAG: hypothetical protein ACYDC9_04000, partial [Dermatophilaceae bacterium]
SLLMSETLVAIGTRKGLWLARTSDRKTWTVDAALPHARGPQHRHRHPWRATATARRGPLGALGPDDPAQ